ncbi:MAG: hypothetical protein ACJ74O_06535 [Frankiaceae bacterium]
MQPVDPLASERGQLAPAQPRPRAEQDEQPVARLDGGRDQLDLGERRRLAFR